jgi:hypothetical protein
MKMLRMLGLAMVFFGAMTVSSCKKDPCKNVTCQNGGICQDGNCKCNPPWEGPRCEVKKDPCENVTCQNGGVCQDGNCKCNPPWEGPRCEVKKDPCENVTCQNGGTCQDGNCKCNLPWEGSRCEVDAREKFVGSWRGTINCGDRPRQVTISITKSNTPTRIIIDGEVRGELTSSSAFDIPNQTFDIDGTSATIYGSGSLNGNQLTLTYVVTIEGAAITCTGTYNKQ